MEKIESKQSENKIKNYLKAFFTNKTIVFCVVFTSVYLVAGFYKWLEIGVPIVALVAFIVLPVQNAFCVFIYSHCFTLSNLGYATMFVVNLVLFCIVMLAKYIIGVKKGRYKVYNSLIIALSVFVAFFVLVSFAQILGWEELIYFTYFPLAYFVFAMRKDLNIHQGMAYMLVGLFLSTALAGCLMFMPGYTYQIIQSDGRFNGFSNHTNYLYMRALFVLTYYMFRYLNTDLSHLKFILTYCGCAIVVLATMSKTGIAMLLLFTLIFVILYLRGNFKNRIKIVLIFLLVLLIVGAICYKFVLAVIDRFLSNNGDFWNSLLTGRDDIWLDYLKAITKNPFVFLFGHGLLAEEVFIVAQQTTRASHNLYLFLLYRFGIVGIIALGYIFYLFCKELKNDISESKSEVLELNGEHNNTAGIESAKNNASPSTANDEGLKNATATLDVAINKSTIRKEESKQKEKSSLKSQIKLSLISALPLIWFLVESLCDNTFKCYNITFLFFALMILFSNEKQTKIYHENTEVETNDKIKKSNKTDR